MRKLYSQKSKSTIVGLIAFAVMLVITQYVTYQQHIIIRKEQSQKTLHELNSVSERIMTGLTHAISAAKTLAFLVEQYGEPRDFDSVAHHILSTHKYIDALELTKGGVVTRVYPVEQNQSAIGYDILGGDQRKEALKALYEKQIFFAGPLILKQGGVALVGRHPIFQKQKFYGFSIVIIRLSTIMEMIHSDQTSKDFVYQLSRRDGDTGTEYYFVPDVGYAGEQSARLDLPHGQWTVYITPITTSPLINNTVIIAILGILLSVACGFLARNVYRRQKNLKTTLDERNAALHARELDYKETLERISDAFISLDKDFEIKYANSRAVELIELCHSGIPLSEAWKLCLDGNVIISINDITQALAEGNALRRERSIQANKKWIQVTLYPSDSGVSLFIEDTTSRVTAQQLLESTANHYRALIENSADAIVLLDRTAKPTYQTPSAERITGYSLSDLETQNLLELTHPENREGHEWIFQKILGMPGKNIKFRQQLKKKSGEYIWIEGTYTNHLDDPNIGSVVCNYHDISDRVASELKAAQASRLYQVISRVNQSIIRATDENHIYQEVCDIAVEVGKFRMAWVGIIDEARLEITPVAYAGDYEGYFYEKPSIRLSSGIASMDVVGNSIHSGRYYVCSDIMDVPDTDAWKASALARSFRSSIALPIKKFNNVTGVFVIYSASTNSFDEQEIALLEEMSQDLSFSLESQAKERMRKQAEEDLIRMSREHEITLNRISDRVISLDSGMRLTFMNDAAAQTHSANKTELIGKKVDEIYPGFEDTAFDHAYRKAMASQQPVQVEEYFPPLDRWFSAKIYPSLSGSTVFYHDVSDHKKYENEILKSQAKLEAILENTSDLVWSVDAELKLLFCNERFRRFVFFLTGKEVHPGDHISSIVPDTYKEDVINLCKRALMGEQYTTERERIYHGEKRVMEYFVNPIRTIQRGVSGVSIFMRDITDKKKALSQIVEERNFSTSIIKSLPGIFYLYDRNLTFRRWNENFEKVTGYTAKEMAKMQPLDLFSSEERPVIQSKIEQVFKDGAGEVFAQLLTKNGMKIPYHFNGHLINIEGAEYLIGMGTDITARVRAEERLEQSIREIGKLSKVASSTDHVVVITGPGLNIEWVNDSFTRLTRLTPSEVTGRSFLEVLTLAGTSDENVQRIVKALQRDGHVADETMFYSRASDRYWLKTNINVVHDVDGTISNYIIVQSDITEIKEYQRRVTSIAQDLRNLIENANAIIFGVDEEGRFNEWNRHATKTTGYERGDMIGKLMVESIADESRRAAIQSMLDSVLEGNNILRKELQIKRKDGLPCILLLSATPRKDASGEIIGVIAVGQDITELTEYRTSLEKQVQIRTEQLNAALEREKELSLLKTRFASMVSHEFRTPLATIGLGANFLKRYRDRLTPEMIDSKSDAILAQVDHMAYLLEDVLTLGKTEDTKIKINRTLVDISSFCNQIKDQVENVTKHTHIIETDFRFSSPHVLTDEDLLRNIFINLLGNAIKFSPGKNRIRWESYQQDDTIMFTVTDYGIGIPEEDREKIFQPFDRGSNTGAIPGTGLGLSIVKKAVELLRGHINVSSDPGKGTVFTVMLPTNPETSVFKT